MLLLYRNSTNFIGVTALEKVTITEPFYLFVFRHNLTEEEYKFFSVKQNPASKRYDLFEITLPDDIDLIVGEYTYEIWQKDNDDNTTIPEDAVLLEIGKARVPEVTPIEQYFHNSIFNGEQYEG